MSRIRQTLSNEDGFDLEHVNAKNNPCGLLFELRKKNQSLKKLVITSLVHILVLSLFFIIFYINLV